MNIDPIWIDCPIVLFLMTIGTVAIVEIIRNHFRHFVLLAAFYAAMLAGFTMLLGFFLFEPVERFWYSPLFGIPLLRWVYLPGTALACLFITRMVKTRHKPLPAQPYTEGICPPYGVTSVYETEQLYLIFPAFDRVRFTVGERQPRSDKRVTFCATAAFQKKYWGRKHSDITGSHVCGGVLYEDPEKYPPWKVFGVFAFFDRTWHFAPLEEARQLLAETAAHGGDAFSQYLLIHEGKQLYFMDQDTVHHSFRTVAQLNGRLCIIDCKHKERAVDHLRYLMELRVEEAIYVDAGAWMNTSWLRLPSGRKRQCFPFPVVSSGNLIQFQTDEKE